MARSAPIALRTVLYVECVLYRQVGRRLVFQGYCVFHASYNLCFTKVTQCHISDRRNFNVIYEYDALHFLNC